MKRHICLSNDKSQSVEVTEPMLVDVTEQKKDDLALLEESDFKIFHSRRLAVIFM